KTAETVADFVEGMQFDKGYISPYFAVNTPDLKWEQENVSILLYEKKLSNVREFLPLLEKVAQARKPLLIIAEDVESEALAKLVGGVAIIKVGAATEAEMKQTKGRVEDALHATRAAIIDGVVAGGGTALLRCIPIVEELAEKLKGNERIGAEIVARALSKPIR